MLKNRRVLISKFAKDRTRWMELLFEARQRYRLSILKEAARIQCLRAQYQRHFKSYGLEPKHVEIALQWHLSGLPWETFNDVCNSLIENELARRNNAGG